MFRSSLLLILFVVSISTFLFGQVSDKGGPFGWKGNVPLDSHTSQFIAPEFDLSRITEEDKLNDSKKDVPWRFGYKYDTHLTINDGTWIELPNEDRLWRIEIICPNAISINLIFEEFYLPEGSYLYLYDKSETNRVGAYTSRNNRADSILGTELVIGDDIIVEYYEPKAVSGEGRFTIRNVIHGYRNIDTIQNQLAKDLNQSGDCNYDVECPLGNGWEDQFRSIAMIVVGGNSICSGALINNTCEDGRPLILSANHCLGGGASTWAFRFNWKAAPGSEACATVGTSVDPGPPYDQTMNGATVLANGNEADHLLLEVDNMTVTDAINWNLYYSGWNADDNTSITEGTCIHHPVGDVMKITMDSDAPYHSSAGSAAVWWVDDYEFGTTEGGSSGSPLYDQNHRIVGQLFGGNAACSGTNPNGQHDYFGRLGVAWNFGVSDHLAPNSCGQALILDGWDPNAISESDDASIQAISSPIGEVCGNDFTPTVILRNSGDNDITSCDINYQLDGGGIQVYNWTGTIVPNGSETLYLSTLSSGAGPHTFMAYTSNPNGTIDSNFSNDTVTVSFNMNLNTVNTFVNITTDCYGYETAWEVHDGLNNLVGSGGNPGVPPGGNQTAASSDPYSYGNITNIQEKLCLAVGCYDFTIYDDWGDGLEGSTQFGCTDDGNYSITNSSGTVLGTIQDVGFGVTETINFCVVNDAGLVESTNLDLIIYPNPANHTLNFNLNTETEIDQITITDINGKKLNEMIHFIDNVIDVANLADGSYFISIQTGNFTATHKFIVKK